jgi:hypothetical protein
MSLIVNKPLQYIGVREFNAVVYQKVHIVALEIQA